MQWSQALDVQLFRWVNNSLANPFLDQVMPFVSGNHASFALLWVALVVAAIIALRREPRRGALFLLMLILVLAIGDGFICNTMKHALARQRPFLALPDVHCLVGKSGSGSMPSTHAANWFAATLVAFVYYRRSLWFMLPAALLVAFSRVYNGVHYPSDVAAGAVLGAGYAAACLWLVDVFWSGIGRRWFPLWWEQTPSLLLPPGRRERAVSAEFEDADAEADLPGEGPRMPRRVFQGKAAGSGSASESLSGGSGTALLHPEVNLPKTRGIAPAGFRAPQATLDAHWLRLGYIFIAVVLVARWLYIAGGTIQLVEDEAYQWLWSKHLALSYYSKPPLIAYTQFLGTLLWGDTAFGVRFFSPLISAVMSGIVLRFFAREVNARAGFFLLLILTATPLLAVGSVLMTIDPLSVLFWTAAMLAGWRAVRDQGSTRDWLWVGLWMGLGFLSKYTELFQLLCWALFFALWAPARKHLRRPGPYLALLFNVVCALPVLYWNWRHGWVTVTHVAEDAGMDKGWTPTLRFLGEFLGSETALLNPVFFLAMIWAAVAFWCRERRNPKLVYLFCMGAPVFLAYLLHSLRSRILPNWIAPSVLPLFCLMVIYWDTRWRLGFSPGRRRLMRLGLTAGLVLGFFFVIVGHNTDVCRKLIGQYLPVRLDPLHRVREWDATARVVGAAREEMLAEGKPVFIITDHYGLAGQISFYLPEARAHVRDEPLVYFRASPIPNNQFYFWPGYESRKGQNAVFVRELDRKDPTPQPPPAVLTNEFESVTFLGVTNVMYHDQYLLRPLQIFACRGLK